LFIKKILKRGNNKMSSVHRFSGLGNDYDWEGVPAELYEAKGVHGAVKRVLVGPADGAPNFVIRYFNIEPGGHSRLERHPHEHGVIILQGKAKVQLNEEFVTLEPLDTVYVAGNDLHQFTNIGDEPLGFICVITANT
jgi:quercetin dioxygenase-like cupin family protein